MGSADFSQFVVTTANETACETSTLKVRALSLRVPAAFTHTSSNFWTSSLLADLSVFLSLICGSCPSGQRFAYSFLQIPSHDGHPCCSAMRFVVAYVRSGLSPVRARPWRAYKKSCRTSHKRCGSTVLQISPYKILHGAPSSTTPIRSTDSIRISFSFSPFGVPILTSIQSSSTSRIVLDPCFVFP